MNAILRFANGDVQDVKLDDTQIRYGQPPMEITWRVDQRVGGPDTILFLDIDAYRTSKGLVVRYLEEKGTANR